MDAVEKKQSENAERTRNALVYTPVVDIYEKDKKLTVLADMPGVDEKAVNVDFDQGVLTIKGTVDYKENSKPFYSEYQPGNYERSFAVPEKIDVEKITAKVENGVLFVTLPYAPDPEPRKIEVKAG